MAKQTTQEQLNVEEALSRSETFIENNKKLIIGAIIAIILIIAGILLYKNLYKEPREVKAQAALFRGQEYFEQDMYETALNGDSISYAGFLKVADEFSGTDAANLAKAYAGLSYAHLGNYEQALKYLNDFNGKDQMVSPAILGATGDCYAHLEQYDKATAAFIKAADKADNMTLSPIYLLKAGQIYEKQAKYNDALNAYNKIKDKYFDSYQAMDIDKYIARVTELKK